MEIDRPTPRLQVETQGSALSAVCAAAGQDQGKLAGMLGCPGFGSCPSLRWAVRCRCSCMAANAQAVATAAPGVPAPGAARRPSGSGSVISPGWCRGHGREGPRSPGGQPGRRCRGRGARHTGPAPEQRRERPAHGVRGTGAGPGRPGTPTPARGPRCRTPRTCTPRTCTPRTCTP